MKNSIQEDDKFKVHVDNKTLQDPNKTKKLGDLQKKNPNIEFDLEPSNTSTSSNMPVMEEVIEPQDQATIKYLSNVKDEETGEISKPFYIQDKQYQMVRGLNHNNDIVIGVYCFDDVNDSGENIIHSLEEFENNIAKPMLEKENLDKETVEENNYDYAAAEREYYDKEYLSDYLNLRDLTGFKHFFVNIETGEVVAKFKTTKEMLRSGIKLQPNEDYMDANTLKKFRFGEYFRHDMNEAIEAGGTDIDKLKTDVRKLTKLIYDKFSSYLSKLDKPIEKVEFLESMAEMIGITKEKMSSLATSLKDIAQTNSNESGIAEKKIMTKNELMESVNSKKVIKTIKIKDIK